MLGTEEKMEYDLKAKPVLKWVGGKRQIMDKIMDFVPAKFNMYFEPFLGGGSVFLELFQKDPNHQFIISDSNEELINVYKQIRNDEEYLIKRLKIFQVNFLKGRKSFYYKTRKIEGRTKLSKAIRFMFLNRTCWNGVYRVNSSGKFNVPMGKYKNPRIVDEDNVRLVSNLLRKKSVYIRHNDFTKIIDYVKRNDFIYLDPPYFPVSETSKFVSYTINGFNENDFERFVKFCNQLDKKGCKVLISNSFTDYIRKQFKLPTWKRYKIKTNRSINCDGLNRTNHHELLIKNY